MLETSPYPLLALKLLGTACPCLEKQGDGPARRAAWAVSSVPIRWHRRPRPSSTAAAAASSSSPGGAAATMGGFLSVMFGGGNGGESGGSRVVSLVGATMSVADSPSGPWLIVLPPPHGTDVVGGAGAVRRKCVPLRMIKEAIREHGNAQKIKHFAQREIEMQRMKKERENRKAKYVKEAGGLKYTAIAMANRS
ncbi:hypothetical protein ACHAW5_001416 [Stephanodiscus triporus]|uniref:Uncharacterized protein n=1 Tax=Stephanodiscus triporus TaxID=2934178 RepID=A0ABD3NQC3_9STRA